MMACACVSAVAFLAASCKDEAPVAGPRPLMPSSDMVLGIVHSGEKMLEDVIVTDGVNFTKTDRNGQFSLIFPLMRNMSMSSHRPDMSATTAPVHRNSIGRPLPRPMISTCCRCSLQMTIPLWS